MKSRARCQRLVFVLLTGLGACRRSPPVVDRSNEPVRGADDGTSAAPWSGMTLDLTPDPALHELRVQVSLSPDLAGRAHDLRAARSWAGTHASEGIRGLHVEDAAGVIDVPPETVDIPTLDQVLVLSRPARGALTITYRAAAVTAPAPLALHVDEGGMSGVGHAFLLLPHVETQVPARVRFHTVALGRGAEGASSFGVGRRVETRASSEDLAHAVYAAGMLWREDGAIGDEMVILGNPAFDTRTAALRVEWARNAIDLYFGRQAMRAPMRFLLVGRPALGVAREGAFLGGSLGVWFDATEPFDDDLTIVVAHELTHAFLGGRTTLTCPDGAEARWFSEGFTVFVARRALFAAGRSSAEGFAADIERVHGARPAEAMSLPDDYRRGDQLAALLDDAISVQTHGKAHLSDVMRELVERRKATPTAAFVQAVRARSEAAGAIAERGVSLLCAGKELDQELESRSFGGCVERRTSEGTGVDLGFDPTSIERSPAIVRGVAHGSAAEKAGLADGALVIKASLPRAKDASPLVDLLLGDGRRVRYKPTASRTVRWVASDASACAAWLRGEQR